MMFSNGEAAMPGVLFRASRRFTLLVLLMTAKCLKVTSCEPLIVASGPSTVLIQGVFSFMIMMGFR